MVNCSDPKEYSPVQSNPDVAGTGVLIGFVGTGFTTILLLLLHYLFVHDPTLDPFRRDDQPDLRSNKANPPDVIFLRKARWLLQLCILTMSDVQIVTGIAIMITGYISVSRGLSAYHWQMLVYTAWFSTVTHVAALSQLRTYLSNRPAKRRWRLILMTALVAMLVVAIVPTIRMTAFLVSIDRRGLERLAVCYFPDYGLPLEASDGTQESVLISIIFSICLVCFSFASRLVRLQPGASSRVGRLRAWCGGMMRRSLVKKKYSEQRGVLYTLLITRPCIAVWLVCRVYVDLFSSAMVEIFWVSVTALWGVFKLTDIRSSGPASENEWSFGQIIAVLLLASPLMSVGETWAESLQNSATSKAIARRGNANISAPDSSVEKTAKFSGSDSSAHDAGTIGTLQATSADLPNGPSRPAEQNSSWAAREIDKWLDRDVYYHSSSWVGLSALVVAAHNFVAVWLFFDSRRDVDRLAGVLGAAWFWYLIEQSAIVALFFLVGMVLDKYTAAWKLRRVLYWALLTAVAGISIEGKEFLSLGSPFEVPWPAPREQPTPSPIRCFILYLEIGFIGFCFVAYFLYSFVEAGIKALGRRRQRSDVGHHPATETGTWAEHV